MNYRISMLIVAAAILLTGAAVCSKPIYNENSPMVNLYSDHRATKVGDIVYIVIDEATTIYKVDDYRKDKNMDIGFNVGSGFFKILKDIGLVAGGSNDSSSTRDNQTDRFTTSVAATIKAVNETNNVLSVECKKNMVINKGKYQLLLRGKVRSDDITPQNTIKSTQIAELQLTLVKEEKRGLIKVIMDFFFQ